MYITDGVRYNADAVGAFNILRKYLSVSGKQKELSVTGLKNPEIIKFIIRQSVKLLVCLVAYLFSFPDIPDIPCHNTEQTRSSTICRITGSKA